MQISQNYWYNLKNDRHLCESGWNEMFLLPEDDI